MSPQLDALITVVTSVATLYLIVGVFVGISEDGRYPSMPRDSLRSRIALILLVMLIWPLAIGTSGKKDVEDDGR